jgi:TPP-dependent trihydroxycyclohexane-1,2-dione (THcHDO) dehydratase
MHAFNYAEEAELFDYDEEAELFAAKGWTLRRRQLGYKRFARAADAIRFVIEELPPQLLVGAYLQVGEARYASKDIRHLYDSTDYPLARSAAVTAG